MAAGRGDTSKNRLDVVASHTETQGFMRHDEPLAAPRRVIPAQAGIRVSTAYCGQASVQSVHFMVTDYSRKSAALSVVRRA